MIRCCCLLTIKCITTFKCGVINLHFPLQTVLLADILPTLIIKITAPFYMQKIKYRYT